MQQKTGKISIKKNYIYNLIYQMVALMVPLITTPYVSRVLGADGVGMYSYTYSMATYFVLFGNLGVNEYGKIQVAGLRDEKKEISRLFWELSLFKIGMTTFTLALFWLTVGIHSSYWKMYIVLGLYFVSSMTDIAWFLQGLEEFKKTAFRSCFIKIAGVVLILLFVKNAEDVYRYAAIINLSAILGNVALWGYMPRYLEKCTWKELHIFRHTRQCLVFFLPVVAASVYSVMDKNMIGWITHSQAENGYYEQAHKIQQTLLQAVLALSAVLLPRVTFLVKEEREEEIRKLLHQSLQFVAFAAFPVSVGLIGIADRLVPWFLGEEFYPSIRLLQIFSMLILLIAYDDFIGLQCLIARGRQDQYNKGIIIGAIVNFVLNCFLIPLRGSVGAALASVMSEIVILIVFAHYGKQYLDKKLIFGFSTKYMLASILMLLSVRGMGYFAKGASVMIWQIGVGALVYFLCCILLGDKLIVDTLRKMLRQRR